MKAWWMWLIVPIALLFSVSAKAAVKREGIWPEPQKAVTLDLDGVPRAQALRKLAEAAGWSLVVQTPLGADEDDLLEVHVKDQPATKVLDLVMANEGWVATRDGSLVSLRREAAPISTDAKDAALSLELPSTAHGRHGTKAKDRVVTGENLIVYKDDTARDVTVFGGNLDVYGEITGDVSVTGGNVSVHGGAHVRGDVAGVGANVSIEDGATVDGDVSVVGGTLRRGEHAHIGGDIEREEGDASEKPNEGAFRRALRHIGDAVTRSAFLFIFGAILLALGATRMGALRGEVVVRPMRSLALGIVGSVGGAVVFLVLCVTIIGIPIALMGLLAAVFAAYAGIVAVLTTAGEALLRHKTQNTYVHLAAGCAMFLAASSLPFVGGFVTAAVALIGIGVVVATRAAGLVSARKGPPTGPYRTAE